MDDWMAGFLTYGLQHARIAFPEHGSSGIDNELPADNRCGYSRGIEHQAFTTFPFTPSPGHHRMLTLRGCLDLCKIPLQWGILNGTIPADRSCYALNWCAEQRRRAGDRCPDALIDASLRTQSLSYSPQSLHRTPTRARETCLSV